MRMKIDIGSFTSLYITIALGLSHEAARELWLAAGFSDGHPSGDGRLHYQAPNGGYRKGRRLYLVSAGLVAGEGDPALDLRYTPYDIEDHADKQAHTGLAQIGGLLDALGGHSAVVCSAHEVLPTDRFKPLVSLPSCSSTCQTGISMRCPVSR